MDARAEPGAREANGCEQGWTGRLSAPGNGMGGLSDLQVQREEFVSLFESRLPWEEKEFDWCIDQFKDVR